MSKGNGTNAGKTPKDFVKLGDGYADITLSRPAEISGAKTGTLRMRETRAGDVETFNNDTGSEFTREMVTFANLCEITPDDVRALPYRDYLRLQAAFALFTS